MKYTIGIDFSISGPAVCIYNSEDKTYSLFTYSTHCKDEVKISKDNFTLQVKPQPRGKKIKEMFKTDLDRYISIAHQMFDFIVHEVKHSPDCKLCFEGYAMGAKGKVFNIAEATGFLKYLLKSVGYELEESISPSTVKMKFHGKGNAKKHMMYERACETEMNELIEEIHKLGYKFKDTSFIPDIVDAFAICQLIKGE
jgi:hypothetical protein